MAIQEGLVTNALNLSRQEPSYDHKGIITYPWPGQSHKTICLSEARLGLLIHYLKIVDYKDKNVT